MRLLSCISSWSSFLLLVACTSGSPSGPTPTAQESPRIGTFDSRAIAVAYATSPQHRATLDALVAERNRAKADGRVDRVRELEAEGAARQERLHEQGFGTADVGELLASIRDEIPAIAEQAGVELIVSKFDVVWQAKGTEFVDVTDLLVETFHPDDRTRANAAMIRKQAPMSSEELRKHHD